MKKSKRILALLFAVLLFFLYGSTLVFALINSPAAGGLLKAAVAATILLPVLMYAYTLVYRLTHKDKPDHKDKLNRKDKPNHEDKLNRGD